MNNQEESPRSLVAVGAEDRLNGPAARSVQSRSQIDHSITVNLGAPSLRNQPKLVSRDRRRK